MRSVMGNAVQINQSFNQVLYLSNKDLNLDVMALSSVLSYLRRCSYLMGAPEPAGPDELGAPAPPHLHSRSGSGEIEISKAEQGVPYREKKV